MEKFKLHDIHILRLNTNGEVPDMEDQSLDFYSSPLVYILNDIKNIYIGESVNIKGRFSNHNTHHEKRNLLIRHAIHSPIFNKSATLHLEAFLINHFAGEPTLNLLNANLGNNGHYYHRKNDYEELFPQIWEKLKELKVAKSSFEQIINSNIFKYSPFKNLIPDQQKAVLACLRTLVSDSSLGIFVQGNAGTGKTIIAIYLLKLLVTPIHYFEQFEMEDPFSEQAYLLLQQYRKKNGINVSNESEFFNQVAIVVSMTSLRETLRKVFRSINHLRSSMVISPTDISKRRFKIVLIDESHRLRQRKNLSGFGDFDKSNRRLGLDIQTGTELDWVLRQSDKQVFFYDINQSIRKTDLPSEKFDQLRETAAYENIKLDTQIRSKGGDLFTDFVNSLFDVELPDGMKFESNHFSLALYESFGDMREEVIRREEQIGLSRLVAGFSWEYKTKNRKNKHLYDITIEGINLRWNSANKDWINSPNAIHEVGSIHTVFGNDLNYIAIIFGKEIDFDNQKNRIVIIRDEYKDRNGKNNTDDLELDVFVKNIYKTLMFRGIHGVFLYACNPRLHEYLQRHIAVVPRP